MVTLRVYLENTNSYNPLPHVRVREIICPDILTAEEYLDNYSHNPAFLDAEIDGDTEDMVD